MLEEDKQMESPSPLDNKANMLFIAIGGFFIANAIIAEFIGVKVFSLEKTLGFEPLNYSLFGAETTISLNLTAGALLWPLEFAISDIINEYFGRRGVKVLTYITIIFVSYAFLMVFSTMQLTPTEYWITRNTSEYGLVNMEAAFNTIFGQGLWIIIGSLIAFFIGQLVGVTIFYQVKKYTGEKYLWLRTTGSTLVSQFVDSFVVLLISFYFNPATQWGFYTVMMLGVVKYFYKFIMAILLTPLIYLLHNFIDDYLGEAIASEMKKHAMRRK
jgi:queuosine precursor transporter